MLSVTRLQTSAGAGLSVTDRENVTVTESLSVTPKATVYAGCNRVTDRTPQNDENLKKQVNVTHKRGFSNAVIEAENKSNLIGISEAELLQQFEREFLKTGTDGGTL